LTSSTRTIEEPDAGGVRLARGAGAMS
jgi:hypothetical protein